jgi:hypothetical protein
VPRFYLVESRVVPVSRKGFKRQLGENETFESDFIGASVEDCQKWERENSPEVNFIVRELIVIVDARSAKDNTVLIQRYQRETPPIDTGEEDLRRHWPPFGILPPPDKDDTWWSYRVKLEDANDALLDLSEFGIMEARPTYYGYKDRLTDEHGVFNVVKGRRITFGEDPETVLNEEPGSPQT